MTSTARRDLLAPIAATACLLAACSSPPVWLYGVGGTVSGLNGTVELRLDDREPYAVAMNGPFTFPDPLEDGASFTVDVSAQPAGQQCSVSGASGTVFGADVTSVTVACTTNLYAIGGTVSGLVGALTLRDAEAGEITVTADGAFTLPNPVPHGAAYDVQIATPEPLQRCTASDASGAVDGADVSAIRIVCTDKTWHPPNSATDFVSPGTSDVGTPSLAMDAQGRGYLVWEQGDGSSDCPDLEGDAQCHVVYLRELDQGVPGELVQLNGELPRIGKLGNSAHVAVTDEGDVIVAWTQLDAATDCAGEPCNRLFVAERRGGTWSLPTSFEDAISPEGGTITYWAVAAAGGSAVIAWSQDDAILLSEYQGGAWTHPSSVGDAINPEGGTDTRNLNAAIDAAGNAIVLWMQAAPCGESLCFQVYFSERSAGNWRHPASVADHLSFASSSATRPQVAMHGGRALIAWEQSGIFLSEHDGTSWMHPASADDAISLEVVNASVMALHAAMSAAGAAVLWSQEGLFADCPDAGECAHAFLSERSDESWIHPADVSDAISLPFPNLDGTRIAMDDRGRIVIAWYAADSAGSFIQMAERRRGVWTQPASASDGIPVTSYQLPEVAVSPSGNAMITWRDETEAGSQLFVSHFD